jgi:hypothetical protein
MGMHLCYVCVCVHGGIRSKSKIFVTWAFLVFANLTYYHDYMYCNAQYGMVGHT